ncbi:hypothetical protein HF670_07435 [Acidithiobacillus thiooxidans]|jgi:hypothetical protein|uniref:hypothetical protein n=1 Tax=Acidithiobacillus thiooxidans TaxID=930 RepID=UPI001C06DEB7|nr:hypothetical protein [Acidithiobacillus thiooxidans]MBU2839397.1 hypothetical protein [Acidithiobacillus thiooxidans]
MKTIEQILGGKKVTKAEYHQAMRSIEWIPAKATLHGVLVDGVLHRWDDVTKPVRVMTLKYAHGGYFSREVLPVDLMLYDIDIGLVAGEWAFLRHQSSTYKKRGGWCLPDYDDPKEAEYHVTHGYPHRYAHLYRLPQLVTKFEQEQHQ